MLRAFIIDDDKISIEVIYRMFPWDELNIKSVQKFISTVGIVEKILNEAPHIVFIDIELYNMSGLDIIRECRKHKSDTIFIIISGHSDFKYAHDAIALDVLYYMLKPIDAEDIEIVVEKLKPLLSELEKREAVPKTLNSEKTDRLWRAINEYCNENYKKKIQVTDICDHLFISRRAFFYVIKKHTEDSFTVFLTKIRLEKAKELLRTTDDTLTAIAEAVGIHDIYYFSNVFKKFTNISPAKYRKQYRENNDDV